MRTPLRRTLTTLLVAVASLAALPAAGHAGARQDMVFEAPTELLYPATQVATLDEIRSLGVSSVRQLVYWQAFAPKADARKRPRFDAANPDAYPAGTWDRLDGLVGAARARGIRLQLTLTGPVPRWATAKAKDHLTRPSAKEYGRWVKAVARRYGSRIAMWSLWNEPNSNHFLKPQNRSAPRLYRSLYIAGAKALRSVAATRRAPILLGETAPRGNPNTTSPLGFLRGMLCLNGSYRRTAKCARLDTQGYAHHAYTTRTGPHFKPPRNDVTIGVLGRLTSALDRAARAKALPRRLKLFLTEFGIQTYPDRLSGVPQSKQPAYLAISEHIAYVNPRVAEFSQYLLRDDGKRRTGYRYGGFETGLRTASGKKKPAYAAFRIPLAVENYGARDVLWGLVRTYRKTTRVTIEVRRSKHGRWTRLRTVRTGPTGVYGFSTRHRKGTSYRVRWTSPTGATLTGPPIGAA